MKSERWYLKLPDAVYAIGPYEFRPAVDEREFRAYVRFWLQVRRLPRGTQVWAAK